MLVRVSNDIKHASVPLTLAEIYERYVSWALTLDYDRRGSVFRESHKRYILTNIAYDVFSGQPGTNVAEYAVSHTRVVERVMEVVTQEPALRAQRAGTAHYEWTQDFIDTNHLLEPADEEYLRFGERQYRFVHPSFFELFVALGILRRVAIDSSLGIRPTALSQATFRSMILYFVREYWTSSVQSAVSVIARRRLSWPDRLLLLYTLEMDPEFESILLEVDQQYFDEISAAVAAIPSFFIRKVIEYQRVIRGIVSPYEYIKLIDASENAADKDDEVRLHRQQNADVTRALLERLDNPGLIRGAPIVIYRLGQLGDASCLPRLQQIVEAAATDSRTRKVAIDAIGRINDRLGEQA